MVRSELVEALSAEHPHLEREQLEIAVKSFLETIAKHLADGGRVELRGFGAFETRARRGRVARNPKNGHPVAVSAKRAVHFKPGKAIRERLRE